MRANAIRFTSRDDKGRMTDIREHDYGNTRRARERRRRTYCAVLRDAIVFGWTVDVTREVYNPPAWRTR